MTCKEIKLTPEYIASLQRVADAAENYRVKCKHEKHCSSFMALKLPEGEWLVTNVPDKQFKNMAKRYSCDCGHDELKQALDALKTGG